MLSFPARAFLPVLLRFRNVLHKLSRPQTLTSHRLEQRFSRHSDFASTCPTVLHPRRAAPSFSACHNNQQEGPTGRSNDCKISCVDGLYVAEGTPPTKRETSKRRNLPTHQFATERMIAILIQLPFSAMTEFPVSCSSGNSRVQLLPMRGISRPVVIEPCTHLRHSTRIRAVTKALSSAYSALIFRPLLHMSKEYCAVCVQAGSTPYLHSPTASSEKKSCPLRSVCMNFRQIASQEIFE